MSLYGFQTHYLWSLLLALIWCGFMVYDTHQIQEKFGYDDYIIAAIELYLDIIYFFLAVLSCQRD
jgi:FtsH-binding integral membrane protein